MHLQQGLQPSLFAIRMQTSTAINRLKDLLLVLQMQPLHAKVHLQFLVSKDKPTATGKPPVPLLSKGFSNPPSRELSLRLLQPDKPLLRRVRPLIRIPGMLLPLCKVPAPAAAAPAVALAT